MWNIFYRNTRLLALTILLIVVSGLAAFETLPRKEDPTLVQRNALVMTRFPGANAQRVESLVTEKIENELQEIEEVRELRSTSRIGISVVTVELKEEVREVEQVWSRVRDRLGDVAAELPPGASEPEFNDTDTEVEAFTLIVGLTWDLDSPLSPAVLKRLAEQLEDELRAVPGTKHTRLFGAPKEEVLVEVDASRLAFHGLTPAEVARRIDRSDAKVPAGQMRGSRSELLMEVEGELDSLDRLRRVSVLQGSEGQVVRLGDLAEIRKAAEDPPGEVALIDGRRGIAVAVRMVPHFRIDRWAQKARAAVESFHKELPRGIGLRVIFDQSRYTHQRLRNLGGNLLLGGCLVVLVILFTMGWKAALLVGISLPLSSLMVLAGMRLLGVPLHQISVTGLIVALGLLIDTSIIMVHEVGGNLRKGMDACRAVARSVRELIVPLFGSTVTTVLAFMPLVLMPGGAGEFVGTLGVSVILALFSSLFVSVTVIASLTGRLARSGKGSGKGRSWWRSGFSHPLLTSGYQWLLGKVFARPVLGILLALVLPVFGFVKGSELKEQFFPPSDRDQFQIQMQLPSQSSLDRTARKAREARRILLSHPEVENVHWFVGGSAPKFYYNFMGGQDHSPFLAQAMVQLRSSRNAEAAVRSVQKDLDESFPSAQVIAKQLEQGPPFDAPIEMHLYGPDLDRLRKMGERLRMELSRVPDVIHTRTTLKYDKPKIWFALDEEEVRLAGLDNVGIAKGLEDRLEGVMGGSILEGSEELPVRVRIAGPQRGRLSEIASLDLLAETSPAGSGSPSRIPLLALGRPELLPEIAAISRRNAERSNTVQGYLTAGVLPAVALERFKKRLEAVGFEPPPGYRYAFGGESEERDRAVGNLMTSAGVLLVLMMATLVLSFNSFRMAGLIAVVGLFSVGLGLAALWLFGYPFGFMAIVGIMGLVGVAINDSIVVLAGLRRDPAARRGDARATRDVVMHSTPHVLSTSITTMAGFTPLILDGGQFWPPLAVAIGGGVLGATLLGLAFVPSAHLLLTRGKAPRRSFALGGKAAALAADRAGGG